jgi:hypothetical protein
MFAPTYFPPSYFAPTEFAGGAPPAPVAAAYFPTGVFAPTYFAPAYFPGVGAAPPATALGLRESLVALLKGDPGVSAVVGTKVFPNEAPQGVTGPRLLYHVESLERRRGLAGRNGTAVASAQIAAGSKNASECAALAKAVRNLLDGFTGAMGSPAGVIVLETAGGDENDGYDQDAAGSDRGTHWTVLDYQFLFREPV